MAISIPIISEFSDKGVKGAQAAFNDLKTKVGEADGAMGKMKAGFGVASDYIKANAAALASAAGAAIAGFAIKAIGDFQDLALEVAKFSDVTRIAAEDSSRWIEVAGDLGIEATSVQDSINKMNKSLASSRDEYDKLGVEIARTKDGTIDANETFIRTVDAIGKIKDPAERARVATQLLGKSWTQVSELVEMGAGSLRQALASVSDAKLIDEAEIQKAKDFRAAQDQLKDAFEDVAITIGSELVPMITKLLESVAPVAEKAGFLTRAWKAGFGAMTGNVGLLQDAISGGGGLDESIDETTMSFWEQQQQMYRSRYEALALTEQFDALDESYSTLKGNIDERQAWRNLQDSIKQAGDMALAAFKEKTPEALRASEEALDRARLSAADYILKLEDIPEQMKTDIIAGLDAANLAEIERTLAYLARPRVAGIIVAPGETPSEVTGRGSRSAMSLGGPVNLLPTTAASGTNVIVNVGGSVTTENDLIESVRKGLVNAQRNGSGLVYANF